MSLLKALMDGLAIFRRNNCLNRAAAISFYAFFSLMPALLLITAVVGFILGSHAGLLERVVNLTKQNLPYLSSHVVNDLAGLSRSWKTFGWISVVMLVLSAELVFNALAEALIAIFDTRERYGFFRRKIGNIAIFLLAAVSMLVSVAATALAKVALRADTGISAVNLGYRAAVNLLLNLVLPFLLIVGAVVLVYRMFAGRNLSLRYAFYGSLVFALLWETAKHVFAWYVSNFAYYNKFYGSLGTVMIFLIWFFFSANIFLLSASLAAAAYKRGGSRRK